MQREDVPCCCDISKCKEQEILERLNYQHEEIDNILRALKNIEDVDFFKIIKINNQQQETVEQIIADDNRDVILRTSQSILVRTVTEKDEVSLRWYINENWLTEFINTWYASSDLRNTVMQHTAQISNNAYQINQNTTQIEILNTVKTNLEWLLGMSDLSDPDESSGVIDNLSERIQMLELAIENLENLLDIIDLEDPSDTSQVIDDIHSNISDLQQDKQDKLTAGTNITIDSNNVISATGGTSYSAGQNIQINNNVISATDTTYSAGTNIQISTQNVISTSQNNYRLLVNWSGSLSVAQTSGTATLPTDVLNAINGKKNRIVEINWRPDFTTVPASTYPITSTFILPDGSSNTQFSSTGIIQQSSIYYMFTLYSIFGENGGISPYITIFHEIGTTTAANYTGNIIISEIRVIGSDQ